MNGKLIAKMANLLCVLCVAAIVCCTCLGCGREKQKAAPAKAVAAPAKAVAAPAKAVAAPAKAVAAPATEAAAPATEETTLAKAEAAPATEEATLAKAVAAPATEEATPATEEATLAKAEATPTTETAAAATEEATLAKAEATLENLMKSYSGECNANVRYVIFAAKADKEGYGQVASLFRAVAAAEQIHSMAQAKVIQKLGGIASGDIRGPEVKSTKENLEVAIQGESNERDTMYPEFIKVAEAEKIDDAVEAFNKAKAAEASHAMLYQEALGNLDDWKTGKKDFFVCPECGNTVVELTFENCPVCNMPKDKFTKIN